ncbi:MAG: site-specific DNA-methyltransferase [Anaerolineae bacterium]|nr:site-specific DNA-methyltransferase [Anaerolineae bacterium]
MSDTYQSRLVSLLSSDLDFHSSSSREFTHDLHAFPAKFPPQLPRKFIDGLTQPGDVVLDPMVGSGTTLLEAVLAGRCAIGFDIDPLALRLCNAKTTPVAPLQAAQAGLLMLRKAKSAVYEQNEDLQAELAGRFDAPTQEFVDYWFAPGAQLELLALLKQIEALPEGGVRSFLELAFSSIIITKSGGVSLALDLAHTRPHRAQDKPYRSPIKEFEKRLKQNLTSLAALPAARPLVLLGCGNAQSLPLKSHSVDLVVTSPPYPANAIDYMRAHKFSLVWMGYPIDVLSQYRKRYIGSEALDGTKMEELPSTTAAIIQAIAARDRAKGAGLHRYYSEMARVLGEMVRVLRPGRAAIVVVGSSVIRGIDTRTDDCLAEIGQQVGFEIAHIGVRNLDRDRRMMPARRGQERNSQIENRMHRECVIGFYKPGGPQ